jgi:exodeoxyribonuclease VII small subunit
VARLESGGLSLDESLTLWERGEHLAGVCTRFLEGARERVEAALRKSEQQESELGDSEPGESGGASGS